MVIKRSIDRSTVIKDVLYVPGIKCNLLSVGKRMEKEFSITMKNEVFKLFDEENKLVIRSPLSKNKTSKTLINSI